MVFILTLKKTTELPVRLILNSSKPGPALLNEILFAIQIEYIFASRHILINNGRFPFDETFLPYTNGLKISKMEVKTGLPFNRTLICKWKIK